MSATVHIVMGETGEYSDHTEWFGPKAKATWRRHGGEEIVRLMGYAP